MNKYVTKSMRLLSKDVALVHLQADLDVPSGPLAGKHSAVLSVVLVRTPKGWMISSFHNTTERLKRA